MVLENRFESLFIGVLITPVRQKTHIFWAFRDIFWYINLYITIDYGGLMQKFFKKCFCCLFTAGIITFSFSTPVLHENGLFVRANDKHIQSQRNSDGIIRESENGQYTCRYTYGSDRLIKNFSLYKENGLLFSLPATRAKSIKISDAGYVLFTSIDLATSTLTYTFYSEKGRRLFAKEYTRPEASGFCGGGNYFGICTRENLEVLDCGSGSIQKYETGKRFDISSDGSVVAVAYDNGAVIYVNGILRKRYNTGFIYHRGITISGDNSRVVIGEMKNIRMYSLTTGELIYSDKLDKNEFLKDIKIENYTVWAGIKYEDTTIRKGILKTYTLGQRGVSSVRKEVIASAPVKRSGLDIVEFRKKYATANMANDPIPWPFKPQDEPHKVWITYEGLNAPSDGEINSWSPYLHQGLDMEVAEYEKCYSVDTGFVKYKGNLGGMGEEYWRVAISPVNISDYSTGWLYAHLIQSTINYDAGEKVPEVGLHLGDIIPWAESPVVDGHIHFANIRDHGMTWSYSDDEWGLTYNPETVLRPNSDTISPTIVDAINGKSKFGYCENNTGTNANNSDYISPDSADGGLSDDVDIVVRLYDHIVHKNWAHPAHAVYYWIKGIDPVNCWSNYNKLIVDTTLSHIRNHAYDFFWVSDYKPYALLCYKVDNVFVVGGWDNNEKTFAHMLTNNNGDSLVTLGEEDSCLHTADYFDGWYRVYAKAYDYAGNFAVDSEDVYFNNGNEDPTAIGTKKENAITNFYLGAYNPGNFGPIAIIHYHVPKTIEVSLMVYDLAGNEIRTLASGMHKRNRYTVKWDGTDSNGNQVSAGTYIYSLKSNDFTGSRKLIYCK